MGWVICFLLLIIIVQLFAINLRQNVVLKSQDYLARMEGMLFLIYKNSEERNGVKLEDRVPRSHFSERHQDLYGLETQAEADARYRDAKLEREEKAKKKK